MLAQKSLQREHAASAAAPSACRGTDLRDRAGATFNGLRDVSVGHNFAVAYDHVASFVAAESCEVRLTLIDGDFGV